MFESTSVHTRAALPWINNFLLVLIILPKETNDDVETFQLSFVYWSGTEMWDVKNKYKCGN